jgi:NADH-quinone oxidoreductase subunit I
MAKGMATTIRHLFMPPITIQYPLEKRELPERSRMSFAMQTEENGVAKCTSCMLCQRSCPDEAIVIESEKRVDGPGRVLTKFTIDLGRCMYCGLCVEQCTSHGLMHTGDFEVAVPTRPETKLVIYEIAVEQKADAPDLTDDPEACTLQPEQAAEGGEA